MESAGGGGEVDVRNRGGGEAVEGAGGGRGGETDVGKGETGGGEMGRAAAHSDVAGVGEGSGAEAGPSRAPPQKPEQTTKVVHHGPGIIIPEKNCMWCEVCLRYFYQKPACNSLYADGL